MPKLQFGSVQVEWHYNRFANRHFVDVTKSGQCVASSRALVEGQWPLAEGLIADVDYSRIPNGYSIDSSPA